MREHPCTVALLRPPETSWYAFGEQLQRTEGQYLGDGGDAYLPAIDDWLDEYRAQILACADALRIRCNVQDYQLYGEGLSGRRRLQIEESDIITMLDPSREFCWDVRKALRKNPDKRAVLAFSSSAYRDELLALLSMKTTLMFRDWVPRPGGRIHVLSDEIRRKMLPRILAFNYREEDRMREVCMQALRYPDCDPPAS